jgi:hypothetical protein
MAGLAADLLLTFLIEPMLRAEILRLIFDNQRPFSLFVEA